MWKPLLRFRKGCATHLSKAFAQGTLFPHSTDAHVYGAAFGLLVGPNEIQPSMVVEHGARSGLGAQPDASKLQVVLLRHWHHGSRLVICYVHGRGSEHRSDIDALTKVGMLHKNVRHQYRRHALPERSLRYNRALTRNALLLDSMRWCMGGSCFLFVGQVYNHVGGVLESRALF